MLFDLMEKEFRIGNFLIYIVPDIGERIRHSIRISFMAYIIGVERIEYYEYLS